MTDKSRLSTRRDFLECVAAVAAGICGVLYFIPSRALGVRAPSNRINIGCIGTGNMGFTDLQGLMHQDDTQIVAVCDVNRGSHGYKTAAQFRGREPARKLVNDYYAENQRSGIYAGCDAYNDFRVLLARDDIDAVSITTPDHWHSIQTIMAARAGKHIYCQKPLSLTIADGRAMVEAVRRRGIILQTGSQHRSKETTRFACELVRNGRIGRVRRVITSLSRHGLRFDIDTRQPTPVPDGFDYELWLEPAPWVPHHQHRCFFLDCIKSGQDPITPVEVGHRSASVCHLANIAMTLECKLHWDSDEERFIDHDQANRLLSKSVSAPWHL